MRHGQPIEKSEDAVVQEADIIDIMFRQFHSQLAHQGLTDQTPIRQQEFLRLVKKLDALEAVNDLRNDAQCSRSAARRNHSPNRVRRLPGLPVRDSVRHAFGWAASCL